MHMTWQMYEIIMIYNIIIIIYAHTQIMIPIYPHTHTHTQLKNMVAALFQSRPSDRGGTRCFSSKGCEFGWSAIENMYQREIARIREGKCSRVPKLKESHILRDSWTRLNVLPSKIMQVLCTFYMYM